MLSRQPLGNSIIAPRLEGSSFAATLCDLHKSHNIYYGKSIGDVTLDIVPLTYRFGGQGVTAMKSELDADHFANEDAAFAYVERQLWPAGPVCPHCGVVDQATKLQGKTTRKGLWNCR